jgi:hypothetical protein
MEELADALGRERLLLELLVFRLVGLRQLLVAGEGRFLGWAADEVEKAARSVRQCELTRAVLISSYADRHGLPDETLDPTALAGLADEPWRTMLSEHGDALRALAAEVDEHAAAIGRLARVTARTAAARLVGDMLERVSP